MGQSPFAKRPAAQDPAKKRRSTRVDYSTPIIFTGRNAEGTPFREKTETVTVNLHGAKLKTRYQVMVGMQVGIENPRLGLAEKAVCVWVGECRPGEVLHEVAVQLLVPKNLWSLENPPEDWKVVEGLAAKLREKLGEKLSPVSPQRIPATPAAQAPSAQASSPETASPTVVEAQYALLEQRVAQLMESMLEILRKQAEDTMAVAVREFEAQLQELESAVEARVRERAEGAYNETERQLDALRQDLAEQLTNRMEMILQSTEEALRDKASEVLSASLPGSSLGRGKSKE